MECKVWVGKLAVFFGRVRMGREGSRKKGQQLDGQSAYSRKHSDYCIFSHTPIFFFVTQIPTFSPFQFSV